MSIAKDIRDKLAYIIAVYEQGLEAKPSKPVLIGMVLHDTITDTFIFQGKRYTVSEWAEFIEANEVIGMTVTGPDMPEVIRPKILTEILTETIKRPVDFLNLRHKKVRKKKEVKQVEPVIMTDKVVSGRLEDYGDTWGLSADRDWKKNKVLTNISN